jgi:hypothetical protein
LLNEGVQAIDDECGSGSPPHEDHQGAVMQGYRQYRLRDVVSRPGAGRQHPSDLGMTVTADGIDCTTNSKTNSP